MCNCDLLPPKVKYARAWGITAIVFGVLNTLGIGNAFTIGRASPMFLGYALTQGVGGILATVAGSLVSCCCIPNAEMSPQQASNMSCKLKSTAITATFGSIFYLIGFVFAIIVMLNNLQCLAVDCTVATVPTVCNQARCQEESEGTMGANEDCISTPAMSGCSAGDMYLSDESYATWDESGSTNCFSYVCCIGSADTPPEGYTAAADHVCGEAGDRQVCAYQWLCVAFAPITYGTLGWSLLTQIVHLVFGISACKAMGASKTITAGPGI